MLSKLARKKWILILLLFVPILGLSLFFVTSRLVENRVAQSEILKHELSVIESKTGLSVLYETAHYSVFNGLVLTNVRIYDTAEKTETMIFSNGEAVLTFRLIDILRGQITPQRLILQDGKFALTQKGTAVTQIEDLLAALKEVDVDLEFNRVTVQKDVTSVELKDIDKSAVIQGSILVRSKESPTIRLALLLKDKQVIDLSGVWKQSPKQRLFIRVYDLPLSEIQSSLNQFPFLPTDISLTWNSGLINGEGSLDLTEDGFAYHLKGDFKRVNLLLADTKGEIRNLSGEFDQMVVSPHRQPFLKANFSVRSKSIDYQVSVIRNTTGGVETHFKGQLTITPDIKLTPRLTGGTIHYDIKIDTQTSRGTTLWTPTVAIQASDLKFILANTDKGTWQSLPEIDVASFSIQGSDKMVLQANGKIADSKFNLSSLIYPSFFQNQAGELIFRHKSDFELTIDQISIESTVKRLHTFIDELHDYVGSSNAVLTEDSGPIWEQKFNTSASFRKYIEQSVVSGQIHIANINDAATDMPSSISMTFRHRLPTSELILNSDASSSISGHYRIHYEQALPLHDMRIEFNISQPSYTSHFFTEPTTQVDSLDSIEFKYTFQSEGAFLADLYYKSLTAFYLKAKHVPVQKDYRMDLLQRYLDINPEPIRYVDIDIERHTSGSLFKPIVYKFNTGSLSLVGNGEFNIFEGGMLHFIAFNKSTGHQNRFSIRIRKDNIWIPSS